MDPLALGIDILTAIVIDSEVFDDTFGDLVQVNAEVQIVASATATTSVGFPLTKESVHRFLRVEPIGPGGAACLALPGDTVRLCCLASRRIVVRLATGVSQFLLSGVQDRD
jgi:hypothetical protein